MFVPDFTLIPYWSEVENKRLFTFVAASLRGRLWSTGTLDGGIKPRNPDREWFEVDFDGCISILQVLKASNFEVAIKK
jgi:hypothetical protein